MTLDAVSPSERSAAESCNRRYRFRDCEIDPAAYRLVVRGEPVDVEPRVFELLAYLIHHRDRVVAKDELLASLWAGKYVTESTLTRAVYEIRRAVGDDSQRQQIIKTLHSRGYQFVAKITSIETSETTDISAGAQQSAGRAASESSFDTTVRAIPARYRWRASWGSFSVLAVVALVIVVVTWIRSPHLGKRERIALAPFSIDANAEDLNWGEFALPGLLADVLNDRSEVAIFSANRVRQALQQKGVDADARPQDQLRALRDVFGVDHVLFAHIGRERANLKADYDLFSANGHHFAGTTHAQGAGGLASALASTVARKLDVAYKAGIPVRKIGPDEFVNESFARGLQALLGGQLEDAVRYFEVCLASDPDSGWARYELGNALRLQGRWPEAEQAYVAARERSERDGDPNLSAAAATGVGLLAWRQGRLDDAEREFEVAREKWTAIDRRANLASAYGNLGVLAENRGDHVRAREHYERALALYRSEGERAGESAVYTNLAVIERKLDNMDAAADLQERAVHLQRKVGLNQMLVFSLAHLGEIERERGRWASAKKALEESLHFAQLAKDRIGQADALISQASLARDLARPGDALAGFREAYSIYRELGNPAGLARTSLHLVDALKESDPAEARILAGEALKHAETLGDEPLMLEIELARADLDGTDLGRLLPRAQALGNHRLLALMWAQRARRENEAEHLRVALAHAERTNAKRLQADLAVELAQMLLAHGAPVSDIEPLLGRAEAWSADYPPALLLRSCYFVQLQRPRHAKETLERARMLLPTPPALSWCPGWESAVST